MLDRQLVKSDAEAIAKRLDDRAPGTGDLVRKLSTRLLELNKIKSRVESLQAASVPNASAASAVAWG